MRGIPEAAYRYQLGSRSAVEWIPDHYQVKTDKASGIVNDLNDWSGEVEDPRYIIDLLARMTLTWDRGMELSGHAQFALETGTRVFSLIPLTVAAPHERAHQRPTAAILPEGH